MCIICKLNELGASPEAVAHVKLLMDDALEAARLLAEIYMQNKANMSPQQLEMFTETINCVVRHGDAIIEVVEISTEVIDPAVWGNKTVH